MTRKAFSISLVYIVLLAPCVLPMLKYVYSPVVRTGEVDVAYPNLTLIKSDGDLALCLGSLSLDYKIFDVSGLATISKSILVNQNLESLIMSNTSCRELYVQIPTLRFLNVSESKSLIHLDVLQPSNKIESLNLSGCTKLSEYRLIVIASQCPELIEVNLNNCPEATMYVIGAFKAHCSKLKKIHWGSTQIDC